MLSQSKGPALFLAQFAGDEAPSNSLEEITRWAADPWLQGRANTNSRRAAIRFEQSRGQSGLLRRGEGYLRTSPR